MYTEHMDKSNHYAEWQKPDTKDKFFMILFT